jgi:hypothetical protein
MPMTLRSRIALLGAVAAFFLPALATSPRGLTHLLTCRQSSQTPFTVVIRQAEHPVLATSANDSGPPTLCGGLALDMRAGAKSPELVTMSVKLTNTTPHPWRGTVGMTVGSLLVPLDLGRIGPGAAASTVVNLHLLPGAHDLEGSLLLGP